MTVQAPRKTSKVTDADWRYPLATANRSGFLPVDDDPPHRIFWEEYGPAGGEPVMFLHGGPGGACEPTLSRFFDPERYRVILFDQRGCGKSTPSVAADGAVAALKHNTTADLVGDIEKLRVALGIGGKMHLFGGSWGSTLAMAYAIQNPDHIQTLILRGIFLGRTEDLLYMYQGNAETYEGDPNGISAPGAYIAYPDEWGDFVGVIPKHQRADMMKAYKAIFDISPKNSAEQDLQLKAAVAWSVWEGVICNLIPDIEDIGKFGEGDFAVCFAQIESHYFANNLFLGEDHILRNVRRFAPIPTYVVHGRFDQVCPLNQAQSLVAALERAGAAPARYVKTAAGHSALERENYLALTDIMDSLPPMPR